MIFTWPLASYVADGIPASAHGEDDNVRMMIPGDHLQLLYHFWLFSDMLTGQTPWLSNPYEFNVGDDDDRREFSFYYFPFSLFFAIGHFIGGHAFGWNFALFLAVWLSLFSTWRLTSRFARDEFTALVFAMAALALPYPWISLLGGSPTGFAMAWVPLLFWGLDIAVRESRIAGGWMACAALILSSLGDAHVFFFSVLSVPVWCVMVFIMREKFAWRTRHAYIRLAIALFPVILGIGLTYAHTRLAAHALDETLMSHGRELREVMLFSPQRNGFFSRTATPLSQQIHLGLMLPVFLAAGLGGLAAQCIWKTKKSLRSLLFMLGLLGFAGTVAILALGPHGPPRARIFLLARNLIPPYAMIRQAGKIYCLMPSLLAVGCALAAAVLTGFTPLARRRYIFPAAIAVLIGLEYRSLMRPDISLLQHDQPAYAAVAADARQANRVPRALAVVLWPGDSHYASIYQHYASLYRIRMVNGYSPAVSRNYFEDVFLKFESINQGFLSEKQADELLEMGVGYIMLHEDLFPEKVSPFPVAFTLKHFLNHSRLEKLKQADRVWAFRIIEEPLDKPAAAENWNTFFPARYPELTRGINRNDERFIFDDGADYGVAVRLSRPDHHIWLPATGCPPAADLRWMIRARGHGILHGALLEADQTVMETFVAEMDTPDWIWIEWPFELSSFEYITLRLDHAGGQVDVDTGLLTAGAWRFPEPGESVVLPAPIFFRAGYIDLEEDQVVFLHDFDEARILFYGPRMPLPAGTYDIEFHHETDAASGTEIGRIHFQSGGIESDESIPVVAGHPARHRFHHKQNLTMTLFFAYHARADMRVNQVTVKRIE